MHERFGALAGAESNILVTARELKRRGHSVAILHGPSTGKGEANWIETFDERYRLEDGDTVQAVKQFGPDVIYVHKMADLAVLGTLLDSCVPLVRMVHDHDLYCMRSYRYNVFTRKVCQRPLSAYCVFPCGATVVRDREGRLPLKWVSYSSKRKELDLNKRFDRMVVATQFMKQELVSNKFEPGQIEVHAPVPTSGDPTWKSSFSDRNVIIYAGQIVRGKGVDVLLESLALLKVPFEAFIFGDGNHRPHCERLARKLNLSGRVHFKGYVSPDEIKSFYQECSVVVVSSVWPEPFGAVGLEGMRYGLPVVAFDAGGIKEWLMDGQNGFLVPWMDRPAFAARTEELLRNKALAREMGERGRVMVGEQYGFSKYVDGIEDLFHRLVQPQPEPIHA